MLQTHSSPQSTGSQTTQSAARSCKPLKVTAARDREQKERQRIHCRHRPYNRQRSERTHLSNLLRYREPQRSSRRLKLAIHRFLKTGFCNAVPLAVLVMLGSVLPALRVPPGEFRPIYRHCHSYPSCTTPNFEKRQ